MKSKSFLLLAVACGLFFSAPDHLWAQGSTFTYQGRLEDNGDSANGTYDFRFSLFDNDTAGTQLGGSPIRAGVEVRDGLFTVAISFGENFPGSARWLQLEVRTNGGAGVFTALSPRQSFTATPYAITAGNVTGPINGSAIVGGTVGSAQLATGAAAANLVSSGQSVVVSGGIILSTNANATDLLNAGYVKLGQAELGELWQAHAVAGPPTARSSQTAVWTGSEVIIWGGHDGTTFVNSGARYNPAANSWIAVNLAGAPSGRYYQTALWYSGQMVIWGGADASVTYGDGGRYDPANDQWTAIPTSPLIAPRYAHTAVWTGSEMIVWGGVGTNGLALNTGGRISGSFFTNTSLGSVPGARYVHQAVWTGSEMLVWGGALNGSSFYASGGHYNPTTDTWSATGASPLAARYGHTMVWTGTNALVWGGLGNFVYGDGATYNPVLKTWSTLNTVNAPAARFYHQAVWTGGEMIISGGALAFGSAITNVGGRYNPAGNSWTALPAVNGPSPRYLHTAIWTGSQMVVWGGYSGTGPLGDGRRYDVASDQWTATAGAPTPRSNHTAVWTGDELIVWGGYDTTTNLNTGARYSPALDNWSPTSLFNAPIPRRDHAAVWTGTEMIVWGGFGGTDGGRYNPVTDVWTPVSTNGAPTPRYQHTAVWTGAEMIIWGGSGGGTTGGRYNPLSDSWTATSTLGVPAARYQHTAVWTGTEMLIWGGFNGVSFSNGARYSPGSNTWQSLPAGGGDRYGHSAVWTGTEMIVWGGLQHNGSSGDIYLQTGARYNPLSNTWTATSTNGAPSIRYLHTGVWTGSEMIIWGGALGALNSSYNTGGRYDPQYDTWSPTTTFRAPVARYGHTAAWTGKEMLVFGGFPLTTGISGYTPAKTMILYQKL